MGSYMLVTRRMYMTLSSPKLAKEVRVLTLEIRKALEDTEPCRRICITPSGDVAKCLNWTTRTP